MEDTQQGGPLIPADIIARKIFIVRGQKIMLDSDLARL